MRSTLLALILALAATVSYAAPKEKAPASKSAAQTELKEMQSAMDSAKKREKELAEKAEKIKAELAPLQVEMAKLSTVLQETESQLMQKEAELTQLQAEAESQEGTLKERRKQIGQSVDAMVQLQRVPPEAVVARPGNVKETIRAAQLLTALNQQLQKDAQDLQTIIEELQKTQSDLEAKKAEVKAQAQTLESQKRELEGQMKTRNALQSKLLADRDSEHKKLDKLSKNSKSLQELIQKIEAEEARLREESQRKARVSPHNASEIARLDSKDGSAMRSPNKQMRMPVTGTIVHRYGDKDSDGNTVRGVRIRARANATVVAPYKGQVVFTGPFLDYGKMVILRHPGGYHSLLAGISQIRCTPGQMMVEGEPIGTMGERAPATELYLELRDHSTPVNPSGWFDGL